MRVRRHSHGVPALPSRQSGAVLVVALMVLLVLTVLGVAGSRGTLVEERMTGNTQDSGVAFQVAEAALRAGERFLQQPELPYFQGAGGLYSPAPYSGPPLWQTLDWRAPAAARDYEGMAGAPGSLSNAGARFIIEELPRVPTPGESLAADAPVDEPRHFRVTARGTGAGGNAEVTLQSTYRR